MATFAGIASITGAQTVQVSGRPKSVTLTVYTGSVTVSFTGTNCVGTNIPVAAGASFSWGVDSAGENLECVANFTGDSSASAIVHYTK